MREVFFFSFQERSLIKEFGWKNSQWHNTHFRKQKNSHKKFLFLTNLFKKMFQHQISRSKHQTSEILSKTSDLV